VTCAARRRHIAPPYFSDELGIDDWKSRCNVPPGGGTLHLQIFLMNWVSMIGKVGAMCRPPAAHCTSLFFRWIGHR